MLTYDPKELIGSDASLRLQNESALEAERLWLVNRGFDLIVANSSGSPRSGPRGTIPRITEIDLDGTLVNWKAHEPNTFIVDFSAASADPGGAREQVSGNGKPSSLATATDWLSRAFAVTGQILTSREGGIVCVFTQQGAISEKGIGSLARQNGFEPVATLQSEPNRDGVQQAWIFRTAPNCSHSR